MADRRTPEPVADERLETILASVGRHLDVPHVTVRDDAPRFDDGKWPISGRGDRRRLVTPRRLLVAAAATMMVAAGVVATPVRDTVADWFGFGHVEVRYEPGLGLADVVDVERLFVDDAVPIDPARVWQRSGLDREAVVAGRLGEPDLTAVVPEGGVVLGWAAGSTTLWVRDAAEGPISPVGKVATSDATIDRIDELGDSAFLIEGEHLLETPIRRVRAANVVWWSDDTREHRLESELTGAALVEIARELE